MGRDTFAASMEGVSIGPYRIVRKLGEGGMGAVWLGEHTLLGRRAAIKVLLPMYSANQGIVQRFFNEARAVTAIADPGIVQVFDFGQHTDGSAFLVMELLDGEAMDARLRRIGKFSPLDALRLMKQIATSLSAAHAKGVIHRDLKPENIFIVGDPAVTGGERPKILDFGIAKLANDEPGQVKTRTGALMGTPVYMSPEQCRGASTVDHRSDLYALGCVLFTMLVGRPPFEAEGSGDIIIAHVRDKPPVPSSLCPGLPPVIDALVLHALEKDPGARFQSAGEFVHAIAHAEAALFGMDFRAPGSMPAPYGSASTPYPGSPTPYPGNATPYPSATTPYPQPTPYPASAAPYAGLPAPTPYPQTPTPYPHAPTPAPASAVTTLGSSVGETAETVVEDEPPPPRRRAGVLVGALVGVAVLAGGAFAMLSGGGKKGSDASAGSAAGSSAGSAAGSSAGSAAGSAAVGTATAEPDAGAAAIEPDAAALAATPDAGVEDAAAAVADDTTPIDAGTRRGSRRGNRRGGDHGTTSGTGIVDRGD